ncbi:hypothetical protein, partial [Salmonella enterica]|uniref:hypothetical protein n=1 Tax=Salmonella enterica TaxID=28901 RepID=UPI00398C5622
MGRKERKRGRKRRKGEKRREGRRRRKRGRKGRKKEEEGEKKSLRVDPFIDFRRKKEGAPAHVIEGVTPDTTTKEKVWRSEEGKISEVHRIDQ